MNPYYTNLSLSLPLTYTHTHTHTHTVNTWRKGLTLAATGPKLTRRNYHLWVRVSSCLGGVGVGVGVGVGIPPLVGPRQ